MSNQGALANFDDEAALAQIASGKLMHQIAAEYGVVKSAIRKRLLKHPDYQQAIDSQAECLVDTATAEVMDVAADAVLIARARARVDAAHKWAAARDPRNWGAKQEVNHNLPNSPLISITLAQNSVAQTPITIEQQAIIADSTVDTHSKPLQVIDSKA